ncbi:hypothetical protein [Desulfovibrio inopinatus]|uniref:hypothetical protein n=1 Tax=Desulfovibrio inopinatus TaxID=102109 RepID=UPI0004190D96|nr:hypothetical protein [Desulfovibrio inopinatus]
MSDSDDKKTLTDYLARIDDEENASSRDLAKQEFAAQDGDPKDMPEYDSHLEQYKLIDLDKFPAKASALNSFRMTHMRGRKEFEATKLYLDTQLEKLTHQAEASKRESKAYWDAKSVEVAETIKTYVQSTIRSLENARLTNRNDAIEQAYVMTTEKLHKVAESDMPDFLKSKLIKQITDNLAETVERLQNDTITRKYDLD